MLSSLPFPIPNRQNPIVSILLVLFFILTVYHFRTSPAAGEFSVYATSVFFEAVGFVLIGCLVGSIIEVFLNDEILLRIIRGKHFSAYFIIGLSGFIFPVCECAIVPVVRSLIKKGLPPSMGMTFLLAVPIMNPVVGLSTYFAFGSDWRAPLLRLLAGYFISVFLGIAADLILKDQILKEGKKAGTESDGCSCCGQDDHEQHSCSCGHDHENRPVPAEWKRGKGPQLLNTTVRLLNHSWAEFVQIAPYFVFGICAAALSRTFLNMKAFEQLSGNTSASSLLMMAAAFTLNLCSEADAFVGASFRSMLPGAAVFAFLVYGPMMDMKLLAMYQSVFSRKTSLFLFAGVTIMTSLVTLLLSLSHAGGVFGL